MTKVTEVKTRAKLFWLAMIAMVTLAGAGAFTPKQASAIDTTWVLATDFYYLQKTVVDNRNVETGTTTTSWTHRVRVYDLRADGLRACTTVYVDKESDGQGWINPLTICDPDGYGGSAGVGWYTAKTVTGWQTCRLKFVLTAGGHSTTKYGGC